MPSDLRFCTIFVSEGGLELAIKPCRLMPSSARSACYFRGFGDRPSCGVPRRAF